MVSVFSGSSRVPALVGNILILIACLLGGPSVQIGSSGGKTFYLGLDWFLLNLIGLALIFVPIEKAFPLQKNQKVFREDFRVDLTHFFFSHVLVQVLVFLSLSPALAISHLFSPTWFHGWISSIPPYVQFFLIIMIADFSEYWIHRGFHEIPFLWRFHSIHHSSREMDWLAGSRIHIFDAVVMRTLTFITALRLWQ